MLSKKNATRIENAIWEAWLTNTQPFFHFSSDILICLTLSYEIVDLNSTAEKHYGWKREEVLGKNYLTLCQSSTISVPLIERIPQITFASPITEIKEVITSYKNNKIITVKWNGVCLRDINGQPFGLLLIGDKSIHSTTDEKQIKDIQNYLNTIIDTIPGSVYCKNKEGVYLGCNNVIVQKGNLKTKADLIGKTDYDVWPEQADNIRKNDIEVMKVGKTLETEETVILPNGETMYFASVKTPLRDENGNIIGVVGNSLDITDRKQKEAELFVAKEKAEVANKAKTEFLENMQHDIRTPLTGIVGFADIIKSEAKDPKITAYADNLVASSNSLLGLLDEILEAIKVSSGEIPLLKKKLNLKNKLNQIISLNQAQASRKNLQLLFEFDPAIPAYLIGDSTRIHRVVLELITNAFKFTEKGHVKLLVQLAKDNEKDVIVKIIVEDTGIGIPADKQQEIYVQFKRLTPSYEGIYKGHGLGLSIAKQLIDDLEGEIYVESEVGKGTKFTFIVKLKKPLLDDELGSENVIPLSTYKTAPDSIIGTTSLLASASEKATESYKSRILVVEDSMLAARAVTSILSAMDCLVDVADRGKLAIQFAEEKSYDLIFMDIGLPDIDGYETTKRIRLNELNKNHVPIIALTAHAGEENKKYCIDIGMNAVLAKPLIREKAEDIFNSFIPYRKGKLEIGKPTLSTADTPKIEAKIVDFELLEQQFKNRELITEMLTMLVDGFPAELAALNAAHGKNDWASVQSITHRIKGGASYCAAMRLKEVCSKLETSVKTDKSGLLEELYKQLLDEIFLTEKTVKENLDVK